MNSPALAESTRVSVKLMAGEEASAIAEAARIDNPDAFVEDHGSYVTISNERRLELNVATIAEELGRPYDVSTLLVVFVSYTGQVEVSQNGVFIKEALAD
ncbi:MAG: MmoB/DmpM family protein [Gammaproteobacteria bacterium]|jgi:hypothetical protein|nr:MmoB/DmpM family protein [Gammaproteobacteria bacterium]